MNTEMPVDPFSSVAGVVGILGVAAHGMHVLVTTGLYRSKQSSYARLAALSPTREKKAMSRAEHQARADAVYDEFQKPVRHHKYERHDGRRTDFGWQSNSIIHR